MGKPWRITFTGIDEECDFADLEAIHQADPRVEFGVLYSEKRVGAGRYPSFQWIERAGRALDFLSLHVCGRAVFALLEDPEALHVRTWSWFQRVQLNGRLEYARAAQLRRLIGDDVDTPIITQFDSNPTLHGDIRKPGHQVLFDASGGRGVERSEWPPHLGDWTCGYAGGLGPDNLATELPRIAAAAGSGRYWIDMEGKLRDERDQFSLSLVRRALDAIYEAEDREPQASPAYSYGSHEQATGRADRQPPPLGQSALPTIPATDAPTATTQS